MGYTTDFEGEFKIEPSLTLKQYRTLVDISDEMAGTPQGTFGCPWVPSEDGDALTHDGGEKSYKYIEWLRFVVETYLKPWGCALSGTVLWQGEEGYDYGKIVVEASDIRVFKGERSYIEVK